MAAPLDLIELAAHMRSEATGVLNYQGELRLKRRRRTFTERDCHQWLVNHGYEPTEETARHRVDELVTAGLLKAAKNNSRRPGATMEWVTPPMWERLFAQEDPTRVFVVDETTSKFKGLLDLVVEYPILTLYQRKSGRKLAAFPVEYIKRFDQRGDLFMMEAGSICGTAAGWYTFHSGANIAAFLRQRGKKELELRGLNNNGVSKSDSGSSSSSRSNGSCGNAHSSEPAWSSSLSTPPIPAPYALCTGGGSDAGTEHNLLVDTSMDGYAFASAGRRETFRPPGHEERNERGECRRQRKSGQKSSSSSSSFNSECYALAGEITKTGSDEHAATADYQNDCMISTSMAANFEVEETEADISQDLYVNGDAVTASQFKAGSWPSAVGLTGTAAAGTAIPVSKNPNRPSDGGDGVGEYGLYGNAEDLLKTRGAARHSHNQTTTGTSAAGIYTVAEGHSFEDANDGRKVDMAGENFALLEASHYEYNDISSLPLDGSSKAHDIPILSSPQGNSPSTQQQQQVLLSPPTTPAPAHGAAATSPSTSRRVVAAALRMLSPLRPGQGKNGSALATATATTATAVAENVPITRHPRETSCAMISKGQGEVRSSKTTEEKEKGVGRSLWLRAAESPGRLGNKLLKSRKPWGRGNKRKENNNNDKGKGVKSRSDGSGAGIDGVTKGTYPEIMYDSENQGCLPTPPPRPSQKRSRPSPPFLVENYCLPVLQAGGKLERGPAFDDATVFAKGKMGIAMATQRCRPAREGELALTRGDIVSVTDQAVATGKSGWWMCVAEDGRAGLVDSTKLTVLTSRSDGRHGMVPKNLIRQLTARSQRACLRPVTEMG